MASIRFREQERIDILARRARRWARTEVLATVAARGHRFPIQALLFGPEDVGRPTFGLFAGVHGLERVGTEIALTYLESLVARLEWDKDARRALKKCRLVTIPMVNPAGIRFRHRANPRGVDLMRNAPTRAEVRPPWLLGGHRLTARLPWFCGWGELEIEARALVQLVERELFPSRAAITLDLHSGFGLRDRLWYPYAKTNRPFAALPQVRALVDLLDRSLPHHVYHVEQQSESYCAHGDLWDYLFDRHAATDAGDQMFLPWTLECGSWLWVRKNPRQLLAYDGPFNPVKPHRHSRTMRRHLALLDFFFRAVRNHRRWFVRSADD